MSDEDFLHSHEATKRVLFHLVNTYDGWRGVPNMMPNELLDDAIRIGRDHLKEMGWWPS